MAKLFIRSLFNGCERKQMAKIKWIIDSEEDGGKDRIRETGSVREGARKEEGESGKTKGEK